MYAFTSSSLDRLTLSAIYPVCQENACLGLRSLAHFDELALSLSMKAATKHNFTTKAPRHQESSEAEASSL
jgi:hypothetical protein